MSCESVASTFVAVVRAEHFLRVIGRRTVTGQRVVADEVVAAIASSRRGWVADVHQQRRVAIA